MSPIKKYLNGATRMAAKELKKLDSLIRSKQRKNKNVSRSARSKGYKEAF